MSNRKALVIMLDGVRADAVDACSLSSFHELINEEWQCGYHACYADNAQSIYDAVTNSAPNHVAIATGVSKARHGVSDNGLTKNGAYDRHPIFFEHILKQYPDLKTGFFYGWGESGDIRGGRDSILYHHDTDENNFRKVTEFLADGGDLTMVYIDMPDHGGHFEGYYPHSPCYRWSIQRCGHFIGDCLRTIGGREHFADEDWLIVILADHGGYDHNHGMEGGNAHTIPLLVCGRNIKSGKMAGSPSVCDVAPTVLKHFGVPFAADCFDGVPRGDEVAVLPDLPLGDSLVSYFDFDSGEGRGLIPAESAMNPEAPYGMFNHCLAFSGADAACEYMEFPDSAGWFEKSEQFTFSCWVKIPVVMNQDMVLLSNSDGQDRGLTLYVNRSIRSENVPGIMIRMAGFEMGQFDIEPGQWMFLSLVYGEDRMLRLYQGRSSGTLYYMTLRTGMDAVHSGLPWRLGQNGAGTHPRVFLGMVDDAAVWNRPLSKEEVTRIFRSGIRGLALGDLL